MAWVNQIKFFKKKQELYVALYDDSHLNEFWIKNIKASDLGFEEIPKNVKLEKKYRIEDFKDFGISSFECSKDSLLFKAGDIFNSLIKGKPMNRNTYYNNYGQTGAFGENARSDNNTFVQNEKRQTLAEAAKEIQELLKQLEQNNPNVTESEQINYLNIVTKQDLKKRIIDALKESGDTAIDEFILENKYLKVIKSFVISLSKSSNKS